MPYIKPELRPALDHVIKPLTERVQTPADLNYVISRMLGSYLNTHGISYAAINALVGVLECVKFEFYRVLAAPYEDLKREQNGDVL